MPRALEEKEQRRAGEERRDEAYREASAWLSANITGSPVWAAVMNRKGGDSDISCRQCDDERGACSARGQHRKNQHSICFFLPSRIAHASYGFRRVRAFASA